MSFHLCLNLEGSKQSSSSSTPPPPPFFFPHSPSIPWATTTCCNSFSILVCYLLLQLQQKRQTQQGSPLLAFSCSLATTATMPPTTRLTSGTRRAHFSLQIGIDGQAMAVVPLTTTIITIPADKVNKEKKTILKNIYKYKKERHEGGLVTTIIISLFIVMYIFSLFNSRVLMFYLGFNSSQSFT